MSTIFPIIRGDAAIPSGQTLLFKNLDPLNSDFVTARLDFYDGSRPSDLDLRMRKDFGRYISPSKKVNALIMLPNFFMEAKGPHGSGAVLKRQITQDAAFGAHGMFEIQSYCNYVKIMTVTHTQLFRPTIAILACCNYIQCIPPIQIALQVGPITI